MCNACGFYCCAYDGFSGCGCDGCFEYECWSDDEHDDEDFDDTPDDYYQTERRARHTARLRCDAVAPGDAS